MVVEAREWRRRACFAIATAAWLVSAGADAGVEVTLRGSTASLARQVRGVQRNDFTLLESASDVRRFVALGLLVPVQENDDLRLRGVSFSVARPAVRTFAHRLARQYRRACGEKLTVTSLTRPASRQPANAYRRSVHRTGMALDIRRSGRPACRRWIKKTLASLEVQGVLEATRERRPPHYHVAIFPKRYTRYVASLGSSAGTMARQGASPGDRRYRVRRGDTLWDIARAHGTTVERLRGANGLRRARIVAGQTLKLPSEL